MALAMTAPPALAVQRRVVTTGAAPVVADRWDQARKQARLDALRVAVEQVMGLRLESRVLMRNELLSASRLAAFTRGGIKHYRVLNEQADGRIYRCRLEVTVTDQPAEMDCPLCGLLGSPTFRLIGPTGPTDQAIGEAEQALAKLLGAHRMILLAGPDASDAEIAVHLEELQMTGSFDGSAETAQARLRISAREISSGQVLAAESAESRALGISRDQARAQAAGLAAQKAGQNLLIRVSAWWNHYLQAGLPLWVEFSVPDGRDQALASFARKLEDLAGMNTCQQLERSQSKARFLAHYLGPRQDLQDEILAAWQEHAGLGRLRCLRSQGRVLAFSLL
jgi:hypothetical protein